MSGPGLNGQPAPGPLGADLRAQAVIGEIVRQRDIMAARAVDTAIALAEMARRLEAAEARISELTTRIEALSQAQPGKD